MTRPVFAGIDGGGTKTALVLVDDQGHEIDRRQATTSNAAVVGHKQAGTVLRNLVLAALHSQDNNTILAGAWFGLSGSDRPEDHRKLRPYLEDLSTNIRLTNDAELVMGALPHGVGLVIVSGTGSIAFGRNADGVKARSGGWGQLIGDEGSGYDLARRMLDAFAREADGRGPTTCLTGRLFDHFGLGDPYQIIAHVYAPETTKADIASLSEHVIEAVEEGDEVSIRIMDESADQLAETASAAARTLGFDHRLDLALTGGLIKNETRFRDRVLDGLRREWPDLRHIIVDDPALTAARAVAASTFDEAPQS